ncbi:MAG TPA: penicillin-insensitive murein endopeptidase [Pseudobdellovibrionaceae bacterium]|nr:penicillin-insensitive murein endopeptidase [Pseudobdellovibrionaceae bacterium]
MKLRPQLPNFKLVSNLASALRRQTGPFNVTSKSALSLLFSICTFQFLTVSCAPSNGFNQPLAVDPAVRERLLRGEGQVLVPPSGEKPPTVLGPSAAPSAPPSAGPGTDVPMDVLSLSTAFDANTQQLVALVKVKREANEFEIEMAGRVDEDNFAMLLDLEPVMVDGERRPRAVAQAFCVDENCARVMVDVFWRNGSQTVKRQFVSGAIERATDRVSPPGADPQASPHEHEDDAAFDHGTREEQEQNDDLTGRNQMADFVGRPAQPELLQRLAPVVEAPTPRPSATPTTTNTPTNVPGSTPSATPAPTVGATPVATPVTPRNATPTPGPTFGPAPTAAPTAAPQATAAPRATAAPTPAPTVAPQPNLRPPVASATPRAPSPTLPAATPTATPHPIPQATPRSTPEPTATPRPTARPRPTAQPQELALAPLLELVEGGRSIGAIDAGRLENGTDLAALDRPYLNIVYPQRRSAFGSGMLVSLIDRVGAAVTQAWRTRDKNYRIQIGDLSKQRGGPFGSHASHQSGLDADIPYFNTVNQGFQNMLDGQGRMRRDFDYEAHWEFFRAVHSQRIIEDGHETTVLNRIFVNPVIKTAFCNWAKENRILENERDRDIMRRIRPQGGHHHHFHLRVKCSPHYPACRRQAEPDQNTGCR